MQAKARLGPLVGREDDAEGDGGRDIEGKPDRSPFPHIASRFGFRDRIPIDAAAIGQGERTVGRGILGVPVPGDSRPDAGSDERAAVECQTDAEHTESVNAARRWQEGALPA